MAKTKIMIVEDQVLIGMTLRLELSGLGYEVSELLSSGEEAVSKIEHNRPDVVIMDISLSGEMDGIEAAKQIKALSDIPIIFLSGYPNQGLMKLAETIKPVGYFLKPVDTMQIHESIEAALKLR